MFLPCQFCVTPPAAGPASCKTSLPGDPASQSICTIGGKGFAFMKRLGANIVSHTSHLGDTPRLEDLIGTLLHRRRQFIDECERMLEYPCRAILVEASYEEINTPYLPPLGEYSAAHPNAISGSLDAVEARFGIPVIYTSSNRALSERKAASWLSKQFTYWWLEANGYGRYLQEGDL